MKQFIIISILIILSILGLGTYRYLFFPNSELIPEYYTNDIDVSHPETYNFECSYEDSLNIWFPIKEVKRVTVCKGFFKIEKKIDNRNLSSIVRLINDSSSYVWGEISTFDPTFNLIFYDKDNKMIGLLIADKYCGQATLIPYLKRQKWGLFNKEKFKELKKLIN